MSEAEPEFRGELPVGVVETFRWASWRSWVLFFGSAVLVGGVGAVLAVVIGVLKSGADGIAELLIKTIPAAVIAYLILLRVANWLVALVWDDDLLDDGLFGRANITVGFRSRDDYILGLLWLCCTPTVLYLAGLWICLVAGIEAAVLEDGLVLAVVVVLGAWGRVLRGVLGRASQAAS